MDVKNKPNSPWWQAGLQLFARLSGWIVGPIILAIVAGKFLDRIFHTEPWLFLMTVVLTFTFSMAQIIRIGLREMDDQQTKDNKQKTINNRQ